MDATNSDSEPKAEYQSTPHESATQQNGESGGSSQPPKNAIYAAAGPFDWKYIQFTEEEQKHLDSLHQDAYGQKYRRIGYYASLQQPHLGEDGCRMLCAREEQPFDERLAENEVLLTQRQQFLNNQLLIIDVQLANEHKNIEHFFTKEQPNLQEELKQLEEDIAKVDEEWTNLRQQLAAKKEELSKGRFEKLKAELNQIGEFAETYRAKAKKSLNEHMPESMRFYHTWLRNWRSRLESQQADVSGRLHRLADAGFSLDERASYRYFYALFGLLATVIAGWFFSIYTSADHFPLLKGEQLKYSAFNGQSLVSILVQAFLQYASHVGGVRFALYGLGVIVAMTAIVVGYDELNVRLIKRRNKNLGISDEKTRRSLQENQVKLESDFEQPDAFFKFNLQAGNWLEFWFKLAPALIIILPVISVIGFLIRNPLSNDGNVYEKYFYPFYNTLYGSWMALALAGVFYIYLVRKLEKPNETAVSRWPGIGLVLVAFFVFLLTLAVDYAVEAIHIQQVALVGFGCMSIVAGVCIGYYLRVSSLLHSQRLYQEEISVVTRLLSHYESMGRIELLQAEVAAVIVAVGNYSRNTATITNLSYAFEIPRYYQEIEARILEHETQEAAANSPPPANSWRNLWGLWQRIGKWFQREKADQEPAKQTKRTWAYTTVKPPVQLKVSDQSLFPVLAEAIALKYEEYCLKQARKEQVLDELLGPHTTPRTVLGRLYAEIEALERKKEEALLHVAEGYFAHQWELTAGASL